MLAGAIAGQGRSAGSDAIAGKMGEGIEEGFVLEKPNIQVFERKPKEPKPEGEEAAKSNGAEAAV